MSEVYFGVWKSLKVKTYYVCSKEMAETRICSFLELLQWCNLIKRSIVICAGKITW